MNVSNRIRELRSRTYLLKGIPKCLSALRAATRCVDEEQVDVRLLPFLDRMHFLNGIDKSGEQALDSVALCVVEGLGRQEKLRSGY